MTHSLRAAADRIAGAPISWGVCEVPGWGFQLPPDRVLEQMREVGLVATEFGPDGFLPEQPAAKAQTLAAHRLAAVGQFVPVVLHRRDHDPEPEVRQAIDGLLAAGASTVVLAAATGTEGYDQRPELDLDSWNLLLSNLNRLVAVIRAAGLTPAVHPHVGTMVESGDEVQRVLDGSDIGICLDTGHLLIGGGDPVALATEHPDRIAHVHLKDVNAALAGQVRSGAVAYAAAVADGLYVPLGAGDVDVAAIVRALEQNGYQGWYVLEQDAVLSGDPATDPNAADPLDDVRTSIAFIRSTVAALPGNTEGAQ
ncbi:TIM barrel protein [Nakamurella aerolata]|uniref:TIM barrel protein n=1 Tax=Nakamurella aerolata TaxID=1656892 RepID=A0A849A2E2_9ACTN|nr:TIM barrel protein [Nakamurella aerolata]NNG34725.1 TIM barrel protein [Nakamurella aerolata]